MAHRYRGGRLAPSAAGSHQLARAGDRAVSDYRRGMDAFMLHDGAAAAFRLIDATNEFIAANAPWTLAKDPAAADRLTQVLFDAAEAIRLAAVLLEPIVPTSSREILRRVGVSSDGLNFDRDARWRHDGDRVLVQAGPLWPRKEQTTVSDNDTKPSAVPPAAGAPARVPSAAQSAPDLTPGGQPAAAPGTSAPSTPAPGATAPGVAPGTQHSAPSTQHSAPGIEHPAPSTQHPAPVERISIDDFMKVELRTAKVLAAERVPKSNKLLKLQVDVGTEHRTLVAGIADAYEPEALVGRTVVIVFNLKPAKLMGIESNGMVLAASPDGGKPAVVGFEEPPPPGTRVR
jgi:methionyl-tRNA synthetase